MTGVAGTSSRAKQPVAATYEYQVCYKCHAGRGTVRAPLVDRVIINTNVADEFSSANASYQPVETSGKNSNVPSLFQDLRTTSIIYCTDCHSSDSSDRGVRGPHGSRYRPLLVRQYVTTDRTSESSAAYALCYGCHNRANILADRSFARHSEHIVDQRAPCSVCHDPHGISAARTIDNSGTHLINFDRRVVLRSTTTSNGPTFLDRGTFRGSCTLNCHGEEHAARTYPN